MRYSIALVLLLAVSDVAAAHEPYQPYYYRPYCPPSYPVYRPVYPVYQPIYPAYQPPTYHYNYFYWWPSW